MCSCALLAIICANPVGVSTITCVGYGIHVTMKQRVSKNQPRMSTRWQQVILPSKVASWPQILSL
jgi:hypothetical protein